MRILIVDKLDPMALRNLREAGFDVLESRGLAVSDLPPGGKDAEILVVRSTRVEMQNLAELPKLKLIIRAGSGTDTIDVNAAKARKIAVSNCPGMNADAVAEMALALLLAVDRQIVPATLSLRQGLWKKGRLSTGAVGLKGRSLGIIGFGRVGQAMASRALALGMNVTVYSRSLTPELAGAAGVGFAASLDELVAGADAVSMHAALTPDTRDLLDEKFFSRMKDGAIFINTSRGETVDSAALERAIQTKGLRVGLDVFAGEPQVSDGVFGGGGDGGLAALATCTPHLGASTQQATEAVAAEVVRIASVFRDTGEALNAVK